MRLFDLHRAGRSKRSISSRGKQIWRDHPAKEKLIEDTKSGRAQELKPKELYESCEEYMHFSLEDFRKHVYQEKYRQIAGPYWQQKRNTAALREQEKKVNELFAEWGESKYDEDLTDNTNMFANA